MPEGTVSLCCGKSPSISHGFIQETLARGQKASIPRQAQARFECHDCPEQTATIKKKIKKFKHCVFPGFCWRRSAHFKGLLHSSTGAGTL